MSPGAAPAGCLEGTRFIPALTRRALPPPGDRLSDGLAGVSEATGPQPVCRMECLCTLPCPTGNQLQGGWPRSMCPASRRENGSQRSACV